MTHWQAALGEPGELVTAIVRNPFENPNARGKTRPVVLVGRDGCQWHVMGLTTRSAYNSGEHRTEIPDPHAVGLRGPGFLWGERLTSISTLDVLDHIGWVDIGLAAAVISNAGLTGSYAAALFRAASSEAA